MLELRTWGICGLLALGLVATSADASEARRKSKNDDAKWQTLYSEGAQALQKKNFAEASQKLEAAFEIAQNMEATDPRQRRTLDTLVKVYMIQRQWAAAEPWLEKIVVVDEEKLGKDHPDLSFSIARLARNYLMMRKFEQAEANYLRAIAIREKSKGFDEAQVVGLRNNLAETYRRWKKTEKAYEMHKAVLARKEAKLGKDHPSVATTLNDMALIYNQSRKYNLALPLLQRAHGMSAKLAKTNKRAVGRIKDNLATTFAGLGKIAEAEKLYREAIAIAQAVKPADRPGMGNSYYNLGSLYAFTKRDDKAVEAFRASVKVRTEEYFRKHPKVRKANLKLADALDRLGKVGEAASIRALYGK